MNTVRKLFPKEFLYPTASDFTLAPADGRHPEDRTPERSAPAKEVSIASSISWAKRLSPELCSR